MKGFRTILFGAVVATAPVLLDYLANVRWTDYVSGEAAAMITGIIVIALRVVTTTPVGKAIVMLVAGAVGSLALMGGDALAGDIANPAPVAAINKALTSGYPTKCGFYYGLGTGGNAGAVNGAAVGTQ